MKGVVLRLYNVGSATATLQSLRDLIAELRKGNVQTDLLYLQASDDILLKRYSETRRRHP